MCAAGKDAAAGASAFTASAAMGRLLPWTSSLWAAALTVAVGTSVLPVHCFQRVIAGRMALRQAGGPAGRPRWGAACTARWEVVGAGRSYAPTRIARARRARWLCRAEGADADDPMPPPGDPPSAGAAGAGSAAGLPPNWRESYDQTRQRRYYWNVETREVQWFRPAEAPADAAAGSPESTLAALLAKRKSGDATASPAQRAARKRMATLQAKIVQQEEELTVRYQSRSPTQMLRRAQAGSTGALARDSERAGEDTFSSYVSMLSRREQPRPYLDWLQQAYAAEKPFRVKGGDLNWLGGGDRVARRGDPRDFDERVLLQRDPAGALKLVVDGANTDLVSISTNHAAS